jgi:cytochrome b
MNARSPTRHILVWDLPTRAVHWLLAASVAGAWMTADSERWIDVHALFGYTALLLVGFRVVWGVAGTRHARFAAFACRPRQALAYLGALAQRRAPRFTGHNPAGAWAIFALLVLVTLAAASGLLALNDIGGHALEEAHEGAANALLALVAVHVAGVLIGSLAHGENLVHTMITGRKEGDPREAIDTPRRIVAAVVVAALVGVWSGAVPLPGLDAASMTPVKAQASAVRESSRDD